MIKAFDVPHTCDDVPLDPHEWQIYGPKAAHLSGAAWDCLRALVCEGPLWDGDVPSKQGRDELIDEGLAEKIVVDGDQGYQAANYHGWWVYMIKTSTDFCAQNWR